jgi:hypothetical protein
MDDFDLDLVDELCSSFCTPCTSQNTRTNANPSSVRSSRKRTSSRNPLENSINKKMCLSDMTNKSFLNEYDEINALDESAIQMLVRLRKRKVFSIIFDLI